VLYAEHLDGHLERPLCCHLMPRLWQCGVGQLAGALPRFVDEGGEMHGYAVTAAIASRAASRLRTR
jgi:hypothetical protein